MMMRNEELERKVQDLRKHRKKNHHGDGSNDNSFSSRPGNEFGSYDEADRSFNSYAKQQEDQGNSEHEM